jgi:hypothetical protein
VGAVVEQVAAILKLRGLGKYPGNHFSHEGLGQFHAVRPEGFRKDWSMNATSAWFSAASAATSRTPGE